MLQNLLEISFSKFANKFSLTFQLSQPHSFQFLNLFGIQTQQQLCKYISQDLIFSAKPSKSVGQNCNFFSFLPAVQGRFELYWSYYLVFHNLKQVCTDYPHYLDSIKIFKHVNTNMYITKYNFPLYNPTLMQYLLAFLVQFLK